MPQDPLTIAIVEAIAAGAIAIIAAQILGQSIATFFGTRASAQISRRTALDMAEANARSAKAIAEIQRETQRIVEREKALRDWRRQFVRPLVDEIERRIGLFEEMTAAAERSDMSLVHANLRELQAGRGRLRLLPLRMLAPHGLAQAIDAYLPAEESLLEALGQIYGATQRTASLTDHGAREAGVRYGGAMRSVIEAAEKYIHSE